MIAIPYLTALTTYLCYGLLFVFGQVRDFFRKIIDWRSASNLHGYAPICLGLEDFYVRWLYLRIQDVSIGLLQVLLMLGLMWLNTTPMTTTKHLR
ncbi:hypothetical protein ACFX2I_005954 [Malus domestica]